MHFFKRHDFDVFCENSAFRRDWHSSAHLLEGLGPHAARSGLRPNLAEWARADTVHGPWLKVHHNGIQLTHVPSSVLTGVSMASRLRFDGGVVAGLDRSRSR